jgi:plastocyanin
VDDEQGKKKRGRRKGGKPTEPAQPVGGQGQGTDIPAEDAGDVTAETTGDVSAAAGASSTKKKRTSSTGGSSPDVSPMDFWRSGQSRSARTPSSAAKKDQGMFHRVRNMYVPPWVPVVGIIFVVFGVLALLFITRSATGAPRIGRDHWHATYTYFVCGEKQPNAPTWEAGVHTHGDGVVHIHPFSASEEGAGARLVKWFEYGGGKLDGDEIRMPGSSVTYKSGDECPDGTVGQLQVFVNSQKLNDWERYIPKDGDRIRLEFGEPQDQFQLEDRIVLPEDQATRTIEMNVSGNEDTTAFDPTSLQVKAGEVVKVVLRNTADVSHGMRFAGADNEYNTGDDFVVVPVGSDPQTADQGDVIQPGGEGFTVIRFDDGGESQFKDPTATDPNTQEPWATGTVIVTDAASPTPAPDSVEQEASVVMIDSVFEPAAITLAVGKEFRINLDNQGTFAHNMRIAGPDGEFETGDDILSGDIGPGEKGDATGKIDAPGQYAFRDDFNPQTMTGTLTIE